MQSTVLRVLLNLIQAFGRKKIASETLTTLTHFVFNQVIGKGKRPKKNMFHIFARIRIGHGVRKINIGRTSR